MPADLAEQFLNAVQDHHEYIPIHTESLRVDTDTGFDLFLQPRPDEPVVLYAERNTPFTEASRRRLVDNKVEYLFISSEQQREYRRYLESNLVNILTDKTIAPETKSEILYASAHGLMRDLLENPETTGGMMRARDMVRCTIGFMHRQRQALRHLITAASQDYEIYTHSVNGFVLASALAVRAGLVERQDLSAFGTGALLRDLGMTRVPETIRDNTGKLTVSQYDQLKRHTEWGVEIARGIGETNNLALELIRHHHEKMDGTGYPDRLGGDEIPPLVRVLTIADVFDALTTNRNHQPGVRSFQALMIMKTRMAAELDPDLLDVFIEMMGNPDG